MSENETSTKVSLLARVNYPLYCVKSISERHILVAGGGGQAKTGIANTCDIYELIYDQSTNTCRANLVTHYDTGSRAIMNLCLVHKTNFSFDMLTGGMDGICNVYDVKMRLNNSEFNMNNDNKDQISPNTLNLRRRHFSFNSQNSFENIEENADHKIRENLTPSSNNNKTSPISNDNEQYSKSKTQKNEFKNIPDYVYEIDLKCSFQTDFEKEEPYQKLIKYSPNANMIFSAGADGMIRFWSLPDYKLVHQIKAHENEVDDIDINPSGSHLVSISRDGKNFVWNTLSGELITALDHTIALPKPSDNKTNVASQNVKYISRSCRYAMLEGDETVVRLFMIVNPLVRVKPSPNSYISKWHIQNDQYRLQRFVSAGADNLSSLAISDDGRFLAVGTLTGNVDVYIAFSLQRCYHLPKAHNIFVTGLEFLPTNPTTLELLGGQADTALVSISVDNHIVLHKIPKRVTLGFLGSFIFFVVFMFSVYLLMNYFDL